MSISVETYHELHSLKKYIELEPYSNRMKIYQLPYEKFAKETIKALKKLAREERCDKLIFYVKEQEKNILAKNKNFYQEGVIDGFFQGNDAYVYARFLEPSRNQPVDVEEQQSVLNIVKHDNQRHRKKPIAKGYSMRHATVDDAPEMAELYDTIFETYPTPMNSPQYIASLLQNDVYFTVVEYNGRIVSASSSDLLQVFNAAEMTDCATLHEHRQKGLLTYQFSYLIERMKQKKVQTLFCYARSVSLGMNLINARHGFTYGGRMVQNSNISGSLECMNIWFKDIHE